MKVLLFGSTGLLGRAIHTVLKQQDVDILAPTRDVVDLNNLPHLTEYISSLNFDVLLNAAACSDTDWCEDNKDDCFRVNWHAPTVMARYAREKNAIFIHFSTDYVFNGEKQEYFEEDLPSPLSFYGYSKMYGERSIIAIGGNYYIVRTSLLFSEDGENFLSRVPYMVLHNDTIVCTHDLVSAPTYAPYLAIATMKLIEKNPPYGIYHITGDYPTSACDFVRMYGKVTGKDIHIKKVKAQELNRRARRPRYSFLNSSKINTFLGIKPNPLEDYIRRIYESISEKES